MCGGCLGGLGRNGKAIGGRGRTMVLVCVCVDRKGCLCMDIGGGAVCVVDVLRGWGEEEKPYVREKGICVRMCVWRKREGKRGEALGSVLVQACVKIGNVEVYGLEQNNSMVGVLGQNILQVRQDIKYV